MIPCKKYATETVLNLPYNSFIKYVGNATKQIHLTNFILRRGPDIAKIQQMELWLYIHTGGLWQSKRVERLTEAECPASTT